MVASIIVPPVLSVSTPLIEQVRFRILRDGVVSAGRKYLRASRSIQTSSRLDIGLEALDGELTPAVAIPRQVLADQPEWLLIVEDTSAPAKVHAQTLVIAAGGIYTINVITGSGSEVTQPGVMGAVVRVSGQPASREVLVVEKKLDGDWRVAGSGATDLDGMAVIDLGVVDGALYSVGLDDFGITFSSGLSVPVGRRIRPSVFAGVLYEVTEAGTLPASEPEWWPITVTESRDLGTARAVAVRYFRPLAHGPISVELT